MGRIGLVVLTIAMLAITAAAQGQGSEITGGYTYLSADSGGVGDRVNMNGWNTGGTYFMNDWLGIEGNFGNVWNTQDLSVPGASVEAKVKNYTYLFGPRFSFGKGTRMNPYFHGLFGFDRLTADTTTTIGNNTIETSASDTGFATAIGGGVVFGMSKHMGINLGGDYLMARHSLTQNNFRISAGVVFRFGGATWGK